MEVVVISLPNFKKRRALITSNLSESSIIEWRIFDALHGDSEVHGLKNTTNKQVARFGRSLTNAEVGCYKSHYSVIKRFSLSSNAEWLVVLEDDVWLDPDFKLEDLAEFAGRNGIDYIRLFAKMWKPATVVANLGDFRQLIRFRTDPYGAQAYLLSKRGANVFLDGLTEIHRPIDDEFGRFWRHGLDAYCVFPFPALERDVLSSISEQRDVATAAATSVRWCRFVTRVSDKIEKSIYNFRHDLVCLVKVLSPAKVHLHSSNNS